MDIVCRIDNEIVAEDEREACISDAESDDNEEVVAVLDAIRNLTSHSESLTSQDCFQARGLLSKLLSVGITLEVVSSYQIQMKPSRIMRKFSMVEI